MTVKCEKCGSTKGYTHICDGRGCGRDECGQAEWFSCHTCGHHTSYYHATALGEAVLKELKIPQSATPTIQSPLGKVKK